MHLNSLPDTVGWRRVVALVAENADAGTVAAATTQAALRGLILARGDAGLVHCFWLLARVVLAARQPDFAAALGQAGLRAPREPGVFDLVAGFTDAVDRHLQTTGRRTDLGEMAQLAATQSLTHLLGRRSTTLFGTTPAEVHRAARELSTQRGFATLAYDFFARFTQRFLLYHLGRELSHHVGGNGRFANPAAHNEFLARLEVYCREAAAIVRDFAGGWYAKANFETGITPRRARGFVNHALEKLRAELQLRGERDGE